MGIVGNNCCAKEKFRGHFLHKTSENGREASIWPTLYVSLWWAFISSSLSLLVLPPGIFEAFNIVGRPPPSKRQTHQYDGKSWTPSCIHGGRKDSRIPLPAGGAEHAPLRFGNVDGSEERERVGEAGRCGRSWASIAIPIRLLDFWSENGINHRVCRSSSCLDFLLPFLLIRCGIAE